MICSETRQKMHFSTWQTTHPELCVGSRQATMSSSSYFLIWFRNMIINNLIYSWFRWHLSRFISLLFPLQLFIFSWLIEEILLLSSYPYSSRKREGSRHWFEYISHEAKQIFITVRWFFTWLNALQILENMFKFELEK